MEDVIDLIHKRHDGLVCKQQISFSKVKVTMLVSSPCHHGMARPQVADGGTASDMEGSCEYIE